MPKSYKPVNGDSNFPGHNNNIEDHKKKKTQKEKIIIAVLIGNYGINCGPLNGHNKSPKNRRKGCGFFFFLVLASPLLFLLSPQNKVSCGFKLFLLLHFGSAYSFQTIFTLLVS
jgi:hypothetical protein